MADTRPDSKRSTQPRPRRKVEVSNAESLEEGHATVAPASTFGAGIFEEPAPVATAAEPEPERAPEPDPAAPQQAVVEAPPPAVEAPAPAEAPPAPPRPAVTATQEAPPRPPFQRRFQAQDADGPRGFDEETNNRYEEI